MGWRDRLLNSKPGTVGRALSKGPHGHGSMPQLSTYNRGGRILSQQDLGRAGMNKGGRAGFKEGSKKDDALGGTKDKPGRHPPVKYKGRQVEFPKDKQTTPPGRVKKQIGGRANLLEEMGRIDARRHPDAADRAEKHRVIGELNRGYNKGGRVGAKKGGDLDNMTINKKGQPLATRVKMKKGGDDKWIQKVDASIKRRGTKGKCTPITKPGCTGRAKALAKTFKKMAKARKK